MDTAAVPMVAAGPPPIRSVKRRHFKALGFARFMASVHVVCDHNFPNGFGYPTLGYSGKPGFMSNFNSFGATWVPFFFLLSGFVITYAKFSNPKNPDKTDPLRLFMRKRLMSIYPLFFFSIFVQLLLKIHQSGTKITTFEWCSLPFTLGLLHAWSPYVSSAGCGGDDNCCVGLAAWNTPTWFLCCLLIYWIAWTPLYHFIRKLSINQILLCMFGCFLYSFLWPIVFTIMGMQNSPCPHNSPCFFTGPYVDIAKFNPLSFWHIYVWGMLLSRLFIEYAEIDLNQVGFVARLVLRMLRHGATIGYISIFGFMILYGDQQKFTSLGNLSLYFRCGGLLPFHTLIIWGLSEETDYVAKVFATYPFTLGELLSFPQYVMQAPVQQFWIGITRPPWRPGNPAWYGLTLYLATATTAYLCAKFVDAPYRAWLDAPAGAKKPPPKKPDEKKPDEKKPDAKKTEVKPELPLGAGLEDTPLVPPSPQFPAAEIGMARELSAVQVGGVTADGATSLDGRECINCNEPLVKDAPFCHMCGEAFREGYAVIAEPDGREFRERPGSYHGVGEGPSRLFSDGSFRDMRVEARPRFATFQFVPRPGMTERQEQADMDLRESLNSF